MLNKWDEKKEEIFNHIFQNIDWKVYYSKDDPSVTTKLSFTPEEGSLISGEFPEISYRYRNTDEYDSDAEKNYNSAAIFFTMVAVNEDVIIDFQESVKGRLRVQRSVYMPSSSTRAVAYTRWGRFKFSKKGFSFVKGTVDGFYEKVGPGIAGFQSTKISFII